MWQLKVLPSALDTGTKKEESWGITSVDQSLLLEAAL